MRSFSRCAGRRAVEKLRAWLETRLCRMGRNYQASGDAINALLAAGGGFRTSFVSERSQLLDLGPHAGG
jgi:hypothetical protein